MSAMIQQTAKLVGVEPKKWEGTIEGQAMKSDRVELHCLIPLDESRGAKGQTAQIFKIQNCDENIDAAFKALGQQIVVDLEMVAGKPGQPPKLTAKSFRAVAAAKAS